ncbi:hypothetical protein ACQYAD_10620 [Neobacillus sp. SM06]|uniref:hypothetical protein n=1 Tax=Neobacillus sp. SM06 TaxID=3422492 RepID=UPI003D27B11E
MLNKGISDYDFLVQEYQKLWKNRSLIGVEKNSESILKQSITKELLDEYSHPRVRKNKYEKFYLSIKKILAAPIIPEAKLELIRLYDEQMERLSKEE